MTILVVDDDRGIRELLVFVLEKAGHRVDLAGDGREGLERFDPERHDLVLTDDCLPGISGRALAERIFRLEPAARVVLMTGRFGGPAQDSSDRIRMLGKPFDVEHLLKTVREHGRPHGAAGRIPG